MSHFQKDAATEKGYSINNKTSLSTGIADQFAERASEVTMNIEGDDEESLIPKKKGNLIWDSKKKRFIRPTVGSDNVKRIKSESGASLPATLRSKRYAYMALRWQNGLDFASSSYMCASC
jgi:ATP-dependent RNA helicase DDX54/DBP10